ncbi:DUF6879 family protein [Streptomyces sp. NPDC049881]|uniref:DUF6879 family protein n=1 Tax=Streptomyces sp. NPDC049881 TaxID=3155778 RepID=UPI00343C7A0C
MRARFLGKPLNSPSARRGGGRKLSRLTGDEFGRLFHSFEHTAFRLETRERYDVDYENESLRKFLAKERDELPWMRDWLTMIRDATAQGRRFHRVRVVSLPLSDYSRFGVWCAQFTNGAGEDIRYLPRDRATAAGLPLHDYWLFDSHRLVRMHFDESDAFLGAEVVEDAEEIVRHNHWRDAAWHHAVGRDEFAAEQHLESV